MKKPRSFHPVLFAIFPVLFLYQQNVEEVSFDAVLIPLAAAVAGTLILWAVLKALLRDAVRAAVLCSVLILAFFSYGHVQSFLLTTFTLKIFRNSLFLPIWATLAVAACFLIIRTRRSFDNIGRILNVVSAALILMPASSLLLYAAGVSLDRGHDGPVPRVQAGHHVGTKPDIYYIILDSYPSARTLRDVFGFDNTPFTRELRRLGFFVADEAFSNYPETITSVPSSLNMQYIHDGAYMRRRPHELLRMVRDNEVWQFLGAQGYQRITINPISDKSTSDFAWELLNTTVLFPVSIYLEGHGLFYDAERQRKTILHAFDALSGIPRIKRPTFTYAHIYCPHEPALFGPKGERVSLSVPQQKARVGGIWTIRKLFVGQLQFVNRKTLEVVSRIIAESDVPPVIIIQGDHGPGIELDWNAARIRDIRERMRILNVYYAPRMTKNALYSSISPVNSFRLVLRDYFGCDLKPLPDRSYFFLHRNLTRVRNVTNLVR